MVTKATDFKRVLRSFITMFKLIRGRIVPEWMASLLHQTTVTEYNYGISSQGKLRTPNIRRPEAYCEFCILNRWLEAWCAVLKFKTWMTIPESSLFLSTKVFVQVQGWISIKIWTISFRKFSEPRPQTITNRIPQTNIVYPIQDRHNSENFTKPLDRSTNLS